MSFTYRGTTSDSMFFNVTERQVYNAPAFDVNAIEVPGRSGDVLNSQQRFKNKTLVYTGFIRSSDFPGNTQWERLSRGLRNIKAWICGDAGKYHDLTDDYDPGFIRRAFVSGETAINILFDRPDGATITITFMAEPFMYEVSEPMELPETKSASGDIITITDGAENTPLKSAVVNIEPVQSGSGDPSPTNIRPISGWSEVNVVAAGGNLFDVSARLVGQTNAAGASSSGYTLSDGQVTITKDATTYGRVMFSAMYLKAGTYTLSLTAIASGAQNFAYSIRDMGALTDIVGMTIVSQNTLTKTFTIPKDMNVAISVQPKDSASGTLTISNIQLELGSVATTYAAPTITPITIVLGQTVYGGTLDVVRGKLNAKPYYASYSGQTLVGPWISSHDKYVAGATPTTGAQVVDMGAAGTEYDVTPQTIKTLLGVNNIWANTGETEVEYIVPTENPTQWPSQPRLEITMSGAGTLTVNGKTWSIGSYTGTLICDSEIMDWYDAGALKNSLVSGDGFPELVPGDNVITYTGGITKVVATPRWRTL